MSIRLPAVDLTAASVGSTGQVTLPQPKVQVGEIAHLRLYNESGCGLTVAFSNGHTEAIPAGAWPMFEIEPEVQTYTWTVTYILPNAPVALLEAVYYFPYEGVPPTPALGNSPIGITGGVQTSSVQTLSNEGNAANTLVMDLGDTGNTNLFTLYTDGHNLWKVDQAGVIHQVLKIQVSGNPLQLGQIGDITEVLGNLTVDGTQIVTGDATFNGAGSSLSTAHDAAISGSLKTNSIRDNTNGNLALDLSVGTGAVTLPQLLTATGQITGAAAQNLILNAVTGKQVEFDVNNAQVGHIDGGGLAFSSKKLFDGSSNNLADWTAAGFFMKGNPLSNGKFQYQADGSHTDWTFSANHGGSFTSVVGQTTVTHGLTQFGAAATPDTVLINDTSGGSMTADASSINSTTFVCAAGQAHAATFWAFKF